jgi:hypothetical protein
MKDDVSMKMMPTARELNKIAPLGTYMRMLVHACVRLYLLDGEW